MRMSQIFFSTEKKMFFWFGWYQNYKSRRLKKSLWLICFLLDLNLKLQILFPPASGSQTCSDTMMVWVQGFCSVWPVFINSTSSVLQMICFLLFEYIFNHPLLNVIMLTVHKNTVASPLAFPMTRIDNHLQILVELTSYWVLGTHLEWSSSIKILILMSALVHNVFMDNRLTLVWSHLHWGGSMTFS